MATRWFPLLMIASVACPTLACNRRAADAEKPGAPAAVPQTPPAALPMGGAKSVTRFFVTSRGLGRGGDLGGLAGADAHCQALAKAEGSGDHAWRAYLSTTATNSEPAINARDRIGTGPWYDAGGDRVAVNVAELHNGKSITQENALTERGDSLNAGTEILTGSRPDGTAFPGADDLTCGNWTSSRTGRAQVGRIGQNGATSWNSDRPSRGCSQQELDATGGSGRFYCFAID